VNLLKSPLRRTTAALAGAFIGLAGAVAFAAPASAHYTELTGKTDCLENGGWTVDWTLTPKNAPIDGKIVKVEESAGGTALKNIVEGAKVATGGTITDSQSFGKDVAEVTLSVKVAWIYEKSDEAEAIAAKLPSKGGEWKPGDDKKVIVYKVEATVKAPQDCEQPPNHPPAEQPSPILEQDCDSMTIGLHNPENGEKVVLRLTPSTGEERILVVKPGKDETTTFEGVKPGFTVTVHIKGVKGSETVPYTQPKNCNTGGSAGGGEQNGGGEENGGGGLPVTGAAASSIAGGAAVLLLAGGTMFLLARRRKVKFTA
jgi:LPXTG-motif cell wall-anchored protein